MSNGRDAIISVVREFQGFARAFFCRKRLLTAARDTVPRDGIAPPVMPAAAWPSKINLTRWLRRAGRLLQGNDGYGTRNAHGHAT
jgi:hypothetical protein